MTNKDKTREKLNRERDRAQQYLDLAGTLFVALDTKGVVTLINKKGCDTLGFSEEEIVGKNWFENFLPERIREEVVPVSRKLLVGKIKAVEYFENPILTKNGTERLIAWHNTLLKDEAGNITGHLSSGEDITERKKVEEALANEQVYLKIMNEVSNILNTSGDLDKAAEIIRKSLDLHGANIGLVEEDNKLHIRGSSSIIGSFFSKLVSFIEFDLSVNTYAASFFNSLDTITTITLDDLFNLITNKGTLHSPAGTSLIEGISKILMGGIIIAPLKNADGDKTGALLLSKRKNDTFGSQEQSLVTSLCNTLALAIERTRYDRKLEENQERLKAILDHVQAGILIIDEKKHTIADANPVAAQMIGTKKENIVGKNCHRFLCPAEEGNCPITDRGHYIDNAERELIRFDGSKIPVLKSVMSMNYRGENYLVESFIDISAIKKAEEVLKTSNDIVQTIPSGLFIYQFKPPGALYLQSGNPEAGRLTGLNVAKSIGKEFNDIWPEAKNQGVTDSYLRVMKTGKTYQTEALHYRDNILEGAFKIRAFKLPQRRLAVAFENVTKQKQAEEELKESRRAYEDLYDNAPDMYVSVDAKTNKIVKCNNTCAAKLGYNKEELYFKPVLSLYTRESARRVKNHIMPILSETGEIHEEELQLAAKNGAILEVSLNVTSVTNSLGAIIYHRCSWRDISERKKTEMELQKAQKLDSLGVLAGGIAHDFNNLLGGIFGYLDLAQEEVDPGGQANTYLEKALSVYKRAKDLTQQLLTFSKGGEPVKKAVSMHTIIHESLQIALSGSNVTGVTNLSKSLKPVSADEGQLSQVFNNLIINARQAMPRGGTITVTGSNRNLQRHNEYALREGAYVKITIADEGTGIPEKIVSQIFDPFFTTKQKGSGLGLAITYSIIKKHEGHIAVQSAMGTGTTFTILLPAAVKTEQDAIQAPDFIPRGTGKILLMDDEEFILNMAGDMLRRIGYEVECAKSGEEALDLYKSAVKKKRKFDSVILDLTIRGGMGGEETIRELRKIDPQVKGIVSSGYSESPVLANPQKHGFMGRVGKPYRKKELSRILQTVINS